MAQVGVQAGGWFAEQHAANHRRFLNLLGGSFIVHVVSFGLLAFTPASDAPLLPSVLTVDLVALPAPGAAPARPAPAPRVPPTAPVPPAPKPLPAKPLPKQVVLPKQAPRAVKKPALVPPRRPEPIEYDDAMSQLRDELGESAPSPVPAPTPAEEVSDEALQATTAPAESRAGTVDREVAAWVLATKRHVRSRYVTPAEFLNRQLATGLEVSLSASGELVGTPRVVVVRASGDPFFDDNAVRTVMKSAPLPPPPRSGTYVFLFTSEER